jgi:hypothetical protein
VKARTSRHRPKIREGHPLQLAVSQITPSLPKYGGLDYKIADILPVDYAPWSSKHSYNGTSNMIVRTWYDVYRTVPYREA